MRRRNPQRINYLGKYSNCNNQRAPWVFYVMNPLMENSGVEDEENVYKLIYDVKYKM